MNVVVGHVAAGLVSKELGVILSFDGGEVFFELVLDEVLIIQNLLEILFGVVVQLGQAEVPLSETPRSTLRSPPSSKRT